MAEASGRRGFGRKIAYVLALVLAGPAAGVASAQSGGAASTPVPSVKSVKCSKQCGGVRQARAGSTILLRGRYFDYADEVVFLGGKGAADDVVADPRKIRSKKLWVTVPASARSGPVAVTTADGIVSSPSRKDIGIVNASYRRTAGGTIDVEVSAPKVFFDGTRKPAVSFVVRQRADVSVELVRQDDGALIARWDVGTVDAGTPKTVTWDGKAGGRVQNDGRYEFRVLATGPDGAVMASSSQWDDETTEPAPGEFTFLRHKFPVRGRHDYGEHQASFGGGRNHQGHDVFAKCGTPLVAARGGVVKLRQTHSRAGHYVVIDGEATGTDYVYMHLRDRALVKKGERVHTGQLIGYIGDTGRAHGCHLHFEMWSAPGWYTGGAPFDPLPSLKAWDRNS